MDDAADRAARSARELARRTRGRAPRRPGGPRAAASPGRPSVLGAGEAVRPPRHPALLPPLHGRRAPRPGLVGRASAAAGCWSSAGAATSTRGSTPAEVVHPLRTGIAAGCRTVILTAAVGGIRADLATGSVMVVEDHLNLTGRSPLIGPEFVDMVDAYAPRLRALALATPEPAASVLARRPGVYAQVPGPAVRDAGRDPHAAHRWAPTWSACRWRSRRSPPARPGPRSSGWPWSPTPAAAATAAIEHRGHRRRSAPPRVPAVAAIVRHVVGSLP